MADDFSEQERPAGQDVTSSTDRASRSVLWLKVVCAVQFLVLLAVYLDHRSAAIRTPEPPAVLIHDLKPAAPAQAAAAEDETGPVFHGRPGPWGEIEYTRINIEQPDEFVVLDDRVFPKTQWVFTGYTRPQLAAFFDQCDLSAAQRAVLQNSKALADVSGGVVVTPGAELVLGLSQAARTKIYSKLAENEANDFQVWPYTYRVGGFDDWFHQSGLSQNVQAQVQRLIYQRGASLCFSDLPEIFSQMPTLTERRRLIKTLSRNSTLLMKLRIRPDADVKALTAYWARCGRAKDIEPLLQSLTLVPGGTTLDVAHLLTPFARKRLNCYPLPQQNPPPGNPDCYWTVMNFTKDPPDDRYLKDAVWQKELQEDYLMVAEPTFGDLVFLLRPDSTPIHAAVYIADDVVFTKNGGSSRQPWLLMKMEDLVARYPVNYPVRVMIFRSKKATT